MEISAEEMANMILAMFPPKLLINLSREQLIERIALTINDFNIIFGGKIKLPDVEEVIREMVLSGIRKITANFN